jgi:hypothetical protein
VTWGRRDDHDTSLYSRLGNPRHDRHWDLAARRGGVGMNAEEKFLIDVALFALIVVIWMRSRATARANAVLDLDRLGSNRAFQQDVS